MITLRKLGHMYGNSSVGALSPQNQCSQNLWFKIGAEQISIFWLSNDNWWICCVILMLKSRVYVDTDLTSKINGKNLRAYDLSTTRTQIRSNTSRSNWTHRPISCNKILPIKIAFPLKRKQYREILREYNCRGITGWVKIKSIQFNLVFIKQFLLNNCSIIAQ